jgi:hypothetical protein
MKHWLYNGAGRWDCYTINRDDPPKLRAYIIGRFADNGNPVFLAHLVGLKTIEGDAVAEFNRSFATLGEAMHEVESEVAA